MGLYDIVAAKLDYIDSVRERHQTTFSTQFPNLENIVGVVHTHLPLLTMTSAYDFTSDVAGEATHQMD